MVASCLKHEIIVNSTTYINKIVKELMDYHMDNKGQPPQSPFEAIEEIFFEFYNDEAINHPSHLM
jgi:hypothetical protein